MQQTERDTVRAAGRRRRTAFGVVVAVVVTGSIAGGGEAAFAATSATDSTYSDLSRDFQLGLDDITLGASIAQTDGTLILGPATDRTTLHLNGKTLTVQAIELTSDFDGDGSKSPSRLTIVGPGTLTVQQTDSTLPAIEVSSGSSLIVSSGTIVASVPVDSTAAAIGGGPSAATGPQNAGELVFNGTARVTATGGDSGAAIGGGYGGSATIDIDDHADVTASVGGGAAAVGAGYGSGVFTVSLLHDATLDATQNGTGQTGAAVGGGASPTGQVAGSVTLGDESHITALSTGSGAAIGGGYHGDGGSVSATGYSSIDATGAQAAIGDGEHATNGGTQVTLSGLGVEVTAHGGTGTSGGAGVGGGWKSQGNDALNVSGGATLTATSDKGPGIGGLGNVVAMQVTVDRAQVVAGGGGGGAAIGAGDSTSIGAQVSINAGSTVTAAAGSGSAIGGTTADTFGSLSNAGRLTIPSGSQLTVPAGTTVGNTGSIVNGGTITVTGTLSNPGVITNTGSIGGIGTLDNSNGTITGNGTVTTSFIPGNNFRVTFDAAPGSASTSGALYVYTDTFAKAGLSLPTISKAPGPFTGWNSASDGSGTWLTPIVPLATIAGTSSSDGSPVGVDLHALYLGVRGPSSRVMGGTSASIGISGLRTNEVYAVKIGSTTVASAKAVSNQPFTVHVTVPKAVADGSQTLTVVGQGRQSSSTILTAAVAKTLGVKLSATKIKVGKKLTVTVSKLYPGEKTTVVFSGKRSKSAVTKANSAGVAVVSLSTLAKGTYTVKVIGAGTSRKASVKLTVS